MIMVRHKREFGDSQGTKQLKLQKIQFKLVAQGLRLNAGVIKDLSDLNEEIWILTNVQNLREDLQR